MAFRPTERNDGYIDGLALSRNGTTPASKLDIAAGRCIDTAGTTMIVTTGITTVDITVSGANGLDTGTEAANTLYAVWMIRKDDGTVAGLLSASFSAPTMPSGYTTKRRIGSWWNDTGSDFRDARQFGTGRERSVRFKAYYTLVDDVPGIPETYTSVTVVGGSSFSGSIDIFLNCISNAAAERLIQISEDGTNQISSQSLQLTSSRNAPPHCRIWPVSGVFYYRAASGHGADLSFAAAQMGYTEWL